MKHTLKLTLAVFTALFTLAFTACNDGGSDDKAGPSAASSFAGASISFNPTVNFLAGNALTYINTEAGSPFPTAATATNGTYTYVPNANFTAGTLTLTVDGITDPIVLEISNFAVRGGKVTRFSARSGGQNYPVTVTGTIAARTSGNNGGGGAGPGEVAADPIPASMRGNYDLVFFESSTGSGIADGTTTAFTITADTLVFGSKTLRNPVFRNGNKLEWIFKDGAFEYAASISPGNTLNEVNVGGADGTPFYGQYKESSATTTVTDGQLSVGTISAVVAGNSIGSGFPESGPTLTDGQTINFTIGSGTASFGEFTGLTFDVAQSNEFGAVYSEDLGNGESNEVSFGYRTAGDTTYVTNIQIRFFRKTAPTDGQAKRADYFLGEITN